MSDTRSDFSSMLTKVMSNPEALQTIMKIAGEMRNSQSEEDEVDAEGANPADGANPAEAGADEQAQPASANPHLHHGGKKRDDEEENRIRLLVALKPYLNEDRREKADIMIRLLKLLRFDDLNELSKLLGDLSK